MSHTTQLRDGWIAIHDGYKVDDESIIEFKRIDQDGKCHEWYEIQYRVIKDFFAEQIGYELESIFEDVDAAGIIDRLIRANRKPKIKNFWERTLVVEDEVPSLAEKRKNPWPIKDDIDTTLKEILAVLEDIHSTLCEPDV